MLLKRASIEKDTNERQFDIGRLELLIFSLKFAMESYFNMSEGGFNS